MGMSDEQFEVYNALINFNNELIEKLPLEEQKELRERQKNILANNKEIK